MDENLSESHQENKVETYLSLVEQRVLSPLRSDAVQQSCTAVLLLAFATIDALGKLIHEKDKACPNQRFKRFLEFMGPPYGDCHEDLFDLRNNLIHNVLNVGFFLASDELKGWEHLKAKDDSEFRYLDTGLLTTDLQNAFVRLRAEFNRDEALKNRATARLTGVNDIPDSGSGIAIPTQPPRVKFVFAR